jgi:hypothetical protein
MIKSKNLCPIKTETKTIHGGEKQENNINNQLCLKYKKTEHMLGQCHA